MSAAKKADKPVAAETMPSGTTSGTPQILLAHHLKQLRLPTILREYDKVARPCASDSVDYARYLLRITELELLDRERRAIERRIRQARFPVLKSLDSFEFLAIPSLNKAMVLELARCEFIGRRENVLLLGNSGTGKTHIALALGLAACQHGHRVRFTTTAALVNELIEARDEKKLLRFQKQIASYELLIVDELGFVPLSKTGAELLFEMLSQRCRRHTAAPPCRTRAGWSADVVHSGDVPEEPAAYRRFPGDSAMDPCRSCRHLPELRHVICGLCRADLRQRQVRIVLHIQPRRSLLDAAQQKMFHRVEADGTQL